MPLKNLNIAVAQLNFLVGDVEGNGEKITVAIQRARDELKADCIVFSELAIIGYPPEDLLFRPRILKRIQTELENIKKSSDGITVVIGVPRELNGELYNAALVLQDCEEIAAYHKWQLPNYKVFDEQRYFSAGRQACVVDIKGCKAGITICEDIWQPEPVLEAVKNGADLIININASPYHVGKKQIRKAVLRERVLENNVPIIYVNQVGGQDEFGL